jgi:hypothetical protein
VLCHAPITEQEDTTELLDYLAERIPIARPKRGHINSGPITEVVIDVEGRSFRLRSKDGLLEFVPPVDLTGWVDLLLTKLSDAATVNPDVRRAVLPLAGPSGERKSYPTKFQVPNVSSAINAVITNPTRPVSTPREKITKAMT